MPPISPSFIIQLWAGFAVVVLGWVFFQKRRLPYYGETHLLTPAEQKFYNALDTAIGQTFHIVYKVRLGDVVRCSDYFWNHGFGRKVATQHIDFVLVERKTSRIRLCLELDDPSHNSFRQKRRDRWKNLVMRRSGVRLVRVKTRHVYNTDMLRKIIWVTLKKPPML